MKTQLLALSMIAMSGLYAQPDAATKQTQNQSNCCSTCKCNPCCCTNPRPCVDCECYVPQFYNLQCDWGFSFDAEFLYWHARETNLAYAARVPMVENVADPIPVGDGPQIVTGPGELRHLSTSWDPGLRIGIGFNSSCDGWDCNLTWTWFQNKQRNSTSVDSFLLQEDNFFNSSFGDLGQFILLNPWINQVFTTSIVRGITSIPTFDRVSARYRLRFNQVDLDLGRKYWLSECFNLRPYIGLRGVWRRTRFSTTSERNFTFTHSMTLDVTSNDASYRDMFRTRSWSVGLIGGLHPTWYFSRCFALYGQIGTGVLWGDFELRKRENYILTVFQSPDTTIFTYADSRSFRSTQAYGILDLGLGLRWERTWCCNRYRSALDLGWEHHIFFDQNHRYQSLGLLFRTSQPPPSFPVTQGYNSFVETTGNLGFGGLVLRLNFDF